MLRCPRFLIPVVLVGCGRTGLEAELPIVPFRDDAGPTLDATIERDASPPRPCPDGTRADPLGTVLWRTPLTTSSDVHYLFCPLTPDSSGATYYDYAPSISRH